MLFLYYPPCTTCKKAQAWLEGHGLPYTPRHIKETNPTYEELKHWYEISGLPADCADVIPALTRGISDGDRQRLARLSAGHFDRLNEALNVLEEL